MKKGETNLSSNSSVINNTTLTTNVESIKGMFNNYYNTKKISLSNLMRDSMPYIQKKAWKKKASRLSIGSAAHTRPARFED